MLAANFQPVCPGEEREEKYSQKVFKSSHFLYCKLPRAKIPPLFALGCLQKWCNVVFFHARSYCFCICKCERSTQGAKDIEDQAYKTRFPFILKRGTTALSEHHWAILHFDSFSHLRKLALLNINPFLCWGQQELVRGSTAHWAKRQKVCKRKKKKKKSRIEFPFLMCSCNVSGFLERNQPSGFSAGESSTQTQQQGIPGKETWLTSKWTTWSLLYFLHLIYLFQRAAITCWTSSIWLCPTPAMAFTLGWITSTFQCILPMLSQILSVLPSCKIVVVPSSLMLNLIEFDGSTFSFCPKKLILQACVFILHVSFPISCLAPPWKAWVTGETGQLAKEIKLLWRTALTKE